MPEPSLSEILSTTRDPGASTAASRTVINTQDLVHQVNQAAQSKAENDWRKYSSFKNDLKDVYKQIGDIQGMAVAQADQPYLKKQAGALLDEIAQDPQGFFGGKMPDIQKKLGNLYRESSQSVQDKIYDDAHRMYLDRDPSLQNDDNKKIMEDYFKQPLGQRKPYTLKLPSLYNPEAIAKQINDSIPQKFSQTGLSPDGKYINTVSGIRYDEKQYKTLADQMYNQPDSRGVLISAQVKDRFNALPPALQEAYKQKYPQDPVKGFYDETVMPWRKQDQIEKTEQKHDEFALQEYKQRDKLQQMNVKFGFDKVIENMKIGGAKEVAKLKIKLQNEIRMGKVGALKGMVDAMVTDAKSGPPIVTSEGTFYALPVSSDVLKSYQKEEGVLKKKVQPDNMLISEDGTKVKQVYYKKAGDPSSGIDENKSRTFSKDEFTARFGKDLLGVSATEKEINADDEDDDSGGSGGPAPSGEAKKPKLY